MTDSFRRPAPDVLGLGILDPYGVSTMLRSFLLMTVTITVAGVFPAGLSALAQNEHVEQFTKCAKVCADCQVQCESCKKHCLKLSAEGKKEHGRMAQMCADCSDCCKTCSALCERKGPLSLFMLECCSKCCDQCAAACEKIATDEHMAACAKSCRECAKICRTMIEDLGS